MYVVTCHCGFSYQSTSHMTNAENSSGDKESERIGPQSLWLEADYRVVHIALVSLYST